MDSLTDRDVYKICYYEKYIFSSCCLKEKLRGERKVKFKFLKTLYFLAQKKFKFVYCTCMEVFRKQVCFVEKVTFNPLQQHAVNTRLALECAECDQPCAVYAMKKLTTKEINDVKYVMSNLLYTCGTELVEYKDQINTAKQYILEKVRANRACLTAVETIYYSSKIHPDCCTWCGSTHRLNKAPNTFPICSPCQVKKTPVVKKTIAQGN